MWLSELRLVLPDRVTGPAALRVQDGRIAEIAEGPAPGPSIRCDGLTALPGFIDMHGDMIEKEVEPRPGVPMPLPLAIGDLDRRLAAAGVTTAYAAVAFLPRGEGEMRSFARSSEMIRALRAAAPGLGVDHRVHARFDVTMPDALGIVRGLVAEGMVDLVSLMDHTPGQGQYRDIDRHVAQVARLRGVDEATARRLVEERIEARSQPAERLAATLDGIAAACRAAGVALASHDDDSAAKVAMMAGFGVTLSEFPVTEDAAQEARARGMAIAMGAPNALRGESYSGNLSARAAHEAGLLDMLVSDYHPSAILPAVLTLAGRVGLPAAAALAAQGPARALGLADRGAIAEGLAADLVLAETGGLGRIRAVLRAGAPIFSDGWTGLPAAA